MLPRQGTASLTVGFVKKGHFSEWPFFYADTHTAARLIGSRYSRLGAPGALFASAKKLISDLPIGGHGFGKTIGRHTNMIKAAYLATV